MTHWINNSLKSVPSRGVFASLDFHEYRQALNQDYARDEEEIEYYCFREVGIDCNVQDHYRVADLRRRCAEIF